MDKERVKRVVAYTVTFAAGACLGVVAGVYVAWVFCLNVMAAFLVIGG